MGWFLPTDLVFGKEITTRIASSNGIPPLHLAAEKGHVDVVRYLVEAGVSPDLAEDDGYTALHGAAEGQNVSSPIRDGWV